MTVSDIMGPLHTQDSREPVNPTIKIPPGGHNPVAVAPNVDALPADEYNTEVRGPGCPPPREGGLRAEPSRDVVWLTQQAAPILSNRSLSVH